MLTLNKKLLILIVPVFLAGVSLFALEKLKITNFISTKDTSISQGPTEEEKKSDDQANAAAKQELIESELTDKGETPTSTIPQTSSIELSAQQETNDTVTVFTKLFNITSGTCNLSITNGSRQVPQTAPVAFQPEYSSCAGFSVNQDDLGAGMWNIALSVNSNGQTFTKTISYQVQ